MAPASCKSTSHLLSSNASHPTNLLTRMIPIVVTRLIYLSPTKNTDPTISSIPPSIITEAAIHFSIIAGSATALKPFLTAFHPTYVIENSGTSTTINSALQSKDRGQRQQHQRDDPYYRLEVLAAANAQRNRDPTADITWRPYQGERSEGFATTSVSTSGGRSGNGSSKRGRSGGKGATLKKKADDAVSGETDGAERMIIQRTMEVSVQYNDSDTR